VNDDESSKPKRGWVRIELIHQPLVNNEREGGNTMDEDQINTPSIDQMMNHDSSSKRWWAQPTSILTTLKRVMAI
jgi:hypothetical protein